MCTPASFILTKDSVHHGRTTNSHEEILRQHNVVENNRKINVVRVEITPPDYDYSLPFSQWKYRVDQDMLPDWYVSDVEEARARNALPGWYHDHIEMQNTDAPYQAQLSGYNAVQAAGDHSVQTAGGDSTQKAGENALQKAKWGSTQTAGDRAEQTAGYCSVQKSGDDSAQKAGDSAVQAAGYRSVQTAGEGSTQNAWNHSIQKAGVRTVQIVRWVAPDGTWKVSRRTITEKTANRPYKFTNGRWRLVKEVSDVQKI